MNKEERHEYLNLLISWPITPTIVAKEMGCSQQYIEAVQKWDSISYEKFIEIVKVVNRLCKAKLDIVNKIIQ